MNDLNERLEYLENLFADKSTEIPVIKRIEKLSRDLSESIHKYEELKDFLIKCRINRWFKMIKLGIW